MKMNRREFILNLGVVGSLLIAGLGSLINVLRFLSPGVKPREYLKVRAANIEDIPPGQALFKNIQKVPFILVNRNGSVRAFSAVCTHLGCLVEWLPQEEKFFCPCHSGYFDADGRNIAGPPPSPLEEYEVEVKDGAIYVSIPKIA